MNDPKDLAVSFSDDVAESDREDILNDLKPYFDVMPGRKNMFPDLDTYLLIFKGIEIVSGVGAAYELAERIIRWRSRLRSAGKSANASMKITGAGDINLGQSSDDQIKDFVDGALSD